MDISPPAPPSTRDRQVAALMDTLDRTTEQIIGRDDLRARLHEDRPLRIKFGVDLTAPDLHLGHAVNLWMMRALQDRGHVVVFLLGDTTSRIGDPSGRSSTRPVLTEQQIRDNAQAFLDQVTLVLRDDPEVLEIRRNSEWFDRMEITDLLGELSRITHARLVSRDMFRRRISAGTDIAMHELIYPVLQGRDSVELAADLTIVGSDQLFNEQMAREMQIRHGQQPQAIITSAMTPGLDGGPKQSKSLGNYVPLGAPAAEKLGRLMTLRDDLVEQWARVYTLLPMEQVADLGRRAAAGGARARTAKLDLAEAIVARHHGADAAAASREEFVRVFSQRQQPSDAPALPLAGEPITALDLVAVARPDLSRSALRRLLEGGGVQLDGSRLQDPFHQVTPVEGSMLRAGRRRWFRIAPVGR